MVEAEKVPDLVFENCSYLEDFPFLKFLWVVIATPFSINSHGRAFWTINKA
jgi:hypothetical protein